MYKEEKMKVLDLLSKNLIDSKTAENILNALDNKSESNVQVVNNNNNKTFKVLKVDIESADGDDVKINIPLEFAKVLKGKSFGSQINNSNFDIDIDEIIELASSGMLGEIVNIDSADGDTIKITIE